MSYQEYRSLVARVFAEGKTTGPNQSEALTYYTDLNIRRMDKWDRRFALSEEASKALQTKNEPVRWLVLTEGWCGDAAHVVPILNHLANSSAHLELGLLLRDEHLDLMDEFLTNGGRSIPKLIRLNQDSEATGSWGPRPQPAQQLMLTGKENNKTKEEITNELQIWYARDRGVTIANELLSLA